MRLLHALLLDPGKSFSGYVLRILAIEMAGTFLISIVAGMIFPADARELVLLAEHEWRTPGAGLLLRGLLLEPAVAAGLVAFATQLNRLFIPSPLLTAGLIGMLGGLVISASSGPVFGLVALWLYFIAAITFHVGRQTSWFYALLAPFLIWAAHNAASLLLWQAA